MAKAVRIHEVGGPAVLKLEEVAVPAPAAGEAVVRQAAVGVNFIDIYHRTGLYPLPLPATIGLEGAGVVEAVGPDVSEVRPGDRVAYAGGPIGAYAERRTVPAARLVPLPPEISFETAAASMLKGMTAWYLIRRTHRVERGEPILVHAAAGGVGQILCQWAAGLGAKVIGAVGSEAKAEIALAHGCAHAIVLGRGNFAAQVRELTGGEGVAVVYDSVGKATWEGSLDSLRPFGLMVTFGNASGPVPPVSPLELSAKGSLFLTRPALAHYTARREDALAGARELFAELLAGRVRVAAPRRFALGEAAEAHRALEERRTTGSTILVP